MSATALAPEPLTAFPPSTRRFDVGIVGGGAVGLATAMALAEQRRLSVLVVEAESTLARHQTGNNSGVIHSGLYYKPGSLKAKLCTEGRELMYRFCAEHSIPHERCGKVVVALDADEVGRLGVLLERGRANGLKDLRVLPIEAVREFEPHVAGVAGVFVEETGIVSYRHVTRAFAKVVRAHGGEVHTAAKLLGVRRTDDAIVLNTSRGDAECRTLVNCGGLQSDRVAQLCGVRPGVRIVPFRGEYYQLKPHAQKLVRNLIYPVPNPAFPFLGVHFTRMAEGGVEAGPNAVLALARHGYSWRDVNWRDLAGTLGYGGFWRMAAKFWRTGFGEMHRSISKVAFHKALARLMPDLQIDDLEPGGAGVRAQAMEPSGALVDDFRIVRGPRMIHVLNAPSPAATASISIGRHVANLV